MWIVWFIPRRSFIIFCVLVLNIWESLFLITTKILLTYCFMPHSFMFIMLQCYKLFLLFYKSAVAVSQPLFFHRLSVTQFPEGSVISIHNPTVSRSTLKNVNIYVCLWLQWGGSTPLTQTDSSLHPVSHQQIFVLTHHAEWQQLMQTDTDFPSQGIAGEIGQKFL